MKTISFIFALVWIVAFAPTSVAEDTSKQPVSVQITLPDAPVPIGNDVELVLTVIPADDQTFSLHVGSFAEYAGIYILGPWGQVSTTLPHISWMHQRHSASRTVEFSRKVPLVLRAKLSEFFPIAAKIPAGFQEARPRATYFRAGRYQINVKFYALDLHMVIPADSGPKYFEILASPLH